MARKKFYMVLDTETTVKEVIEEVNAYNALTYDIGYTVCDKQGNVYEKKHFLVEEIFTNINLMKHAFYFSKFPMYINMVQNGEITIKPFMEIESIVREDIAKYDIEEVWAFNMYFDHVALNQTRHFLYGDRFTDGWGFFPLGTKVKCILRFAETCLTNQKMYKPFCETHNCYWVDKWGNHRPRKNAETVYKYISGEYDFIEEHTSLADCMIETEILAKCFSQHKKRKPSILIEIY